MRTLSNIIEFSKCKHIFLLLFLSGSGLLHNFLNAQVMYAKLTDNEIRTVIPILRSEIAGYTRLEDGIAKERDLKYQLFLDIQSGKTDPLNWLKQHSKHIIVPPGATYQPGCSREVSIKGKELFKDADSDMKPSSVPTAVFTFGKELPSVNKQLLGNTITHESFNKFMENPYDGSDPGVEKMRSIIKDADSFYTKNGFSTSYGMSYGNAVSFYHPDDEGLISGVVNIFDITLLDPTYTDVVKQCRTQIMGPVVEISAEYKLLDQILGSPDISKSIDENTRNNLKKAGIPEDRYALVKASLLNARRDSENPDGIEIPSLDITPTTQEEKEMARIIEQMKQDALARKNNITIYNKFKAELDPIIDVLQKYMGGQ
jgi:hypothetical protein